MVDIKEKQLWRKDTLDHKSLPPKIKVTGHALDTLGVMTTLFFVVARAPLGVGMRKVLSGTHNHWPGSFLL